MRHIRSGLYVVVGCAAVAAGIVAYVPVALSATPPKTPVKVHPGTYSGTVQMGVNVGGAPPYYLASLTGHWTLTVDKTDHLRGTENMQGTVPFKPASGCTDSPASWTLGFDATLGTYFLGGSGTPGFVQGTSVIIKLNNDNPGWTGWPATPATYNQTCGSGAPGSWPISVVAGYGETSVPVQATVHLPIGLFENRGRPYRVGFANILKEPFQQTYALVSGPKP